MNLARPLSNLALAAAAAALLLPGSGAAAPACDEGTARNLLFTSRIASILHPSDKEDVEFFTSRGGAPNVLIVLDTSGSMERLPPDGPHSLGFGGGAYTTANPIIGTDVPQGFLVTNRGSTTQQNNALAAPVATRVVGCGLDPVSAAQANFMTFPQLASIDTRRFSPPCPNEFADLTLKGQPYQGHTRDYADSMKVCPRFVSAADPQHVGDPGFDPDYYVNSNNLTGGGGVAGRINFFPRDLVFHDNEAVGSYGTNNLAFGHNFGDGWSDSNLFPARIPWGPPAGYTAGDIASIDGFCETFKGNTVMQGLLSRSDICKSCLKTKGWWYDGIILTTSDNGSNYGYPSIWYTGNYLSFFPPKFMVAKKVLKDLVATQSNVRMAMSTFDAAGSTPRLPFAPTCTADAAGTTFEPSRQTFVNSINGIAFGGGTPLSRTLFDAGRYYHTPSLPWFGATWENAAKESSSVKDNYAICYACQGSSIILMTDGAPNPPDGDGTDLPSGGLTAAQVTGSLYAGDAATGVRGISQALCPQCSSFACAAAPTGDGNCATADYRDNTAKVAFYLHHMDLRKNDEDTLDCKKNGGKQTVDVYTVGFGTTALPSANQILQNTANAGGGTFVPAEDTTTLKSAFNNIFTQINNRSTSFSTATVSTLQTTAGRSVIVPRFDPSTSQLWRGHLARFDLYSEFVNTCEETAAGNGAGDLDCDGDCTSVFLQDKDGDFISEDTTGVFRKNDPPNLPTCESAPICQAKGRPCATTGSGLADSWWDAGDALVIRSWKSRRVYSVVDSTGDGQIDQNDPVFELDSSGTAAATALVPYLGIGGKLLAPGAGSAICNAISNRLAGNGKLAWAASVATDKVECARSIIRYLKGADLFNETSNAGYAALADQELLFDRAFKLGDIFHSSPVVVEPPYPADGIMCKLSLANQCLPSLWQTPTKHANDGNAYQEYVKSADFENRRKVVLVGANDGLVHAFNGGTWRANLDDPTTTALDESKAPFNGYYERGDLSGGATELWAFLPPGLIGKIPLLLGNSHQIYADGSPMVRDVWVDGTSNGLAGAAVADDVKQKQEFHTLAIFPLRRGGTHFFALDVTSATEIATPPRFLWMFPQPNDKRTLAMGETYDSFLPRPPPIGPVRILADAASGPANANTPVWAQALGGATPYHEKWVAFLNGGWDPLFLRGRGAYMVDAWTGASIWDFAYPDDPTSVPATDPRLQLRYPVPSTIGMIPWGQNPKRRFGEKNDWFFDSATFGDAGGQLWMLRFSEPGKLSGAGGMVTNWFGGRTFQMGGSAACKLCGGQPFFYMTGNAQLPESGYLRVYTGTGDRFNMLDAQPGGQCGPDNLRACALRGCTVNVDAPNNFVGSSDLGLRSFSASAVACGNLTQGQSDAPFGATCAAKGSARVTISCPSPASSTVKFISAICENQEDGDYACATSTSINGSDLTLSDVTNAPNLGNWMFSLLGFEEVGNRTIFSTQAQANAYDSARLFVTQAGAARSATAGIVMMASNDDNPSPLATTTSKGWAIYYNHDVSAVVDGQTYSVNWMDERTVTPTAIGSRYVTWAAIQTAKLASAAGSCSKNKCAFENQRVSYRYAADIATGEPFALDPTAPSTKLRSIAGLNFVPPQADQATVFINQQGQVAVGLTSVSPESGARNLSVGDPKDANYGLGVLEVSGQEHACRHAWPGRIDPSAGDGAGVPPTQEVCK